MLELLYIVLRSRLGGFPIINLVPSLTQHYTCSYMLTGLMLKW